MALHVDRPLRLGELVAETIRFYGDRIWASLGLGVVVAGLLLLGVLTGHTVGSILVISVAFTAALAAASRLVAGDRFQEAWAQVLLRTPVLLVLTLVVSVPFTLGQIDPLLLIFAVAWLALSGFSIPVAMLERDPQAETWYGRLAFALHRSVRLARAEYLHALGVSAALVLIYIVFSVVLAALLAGFADNGGLAATTLTQVVLAPFFFIGLAVLYFEQRVRAVSSPGPS